MRVFTFATASKTNVHLRQRILGRDRLQSHRGVAHALNASHRKVSLTHRNHLVIIMVYPACRTLDTSSVLRCQLAEGNYTFHTYRVGARAPAMQ